ncbi:hypothetical protein ACFL6X_06385 [Candidatus Latescibacterota bacterium]
MGIAPFAPRDGAGALAYRDKMWLLGGWNPGDKSHFPLICSNDVWSSEDGAGWVEEKPNTFQVKDEELRGDWEGRHTSGYAIHRDRMWIVGGDPIQGHYQGDVWSSADGRGWVCATDQVPWAPRALHHTVAFQGHLWVMGGQTVPQFAGAETRFFGDVWRSVDGAEWEEVGTRGQMWAPRGMIGGSAVLHDRMWILGGGRYDTPDVPDRAFYNDVWSSADGVHWERHLEEAPWSPRQYHEVAVWDGKLWVLEGWNQENRNDVWYSEDGDAWHELPDTPWAPRHAASVFVFADSLWMVAGNNMESDVWRLVREPGEGRSEP